jgi:UDP-N-acetylmuramoyl-tripeptide--D-alanyl-D-alanine ligase
VNDVGLTAGWVAEVLQPDGGRLVKGERGREFAGVSIDTRTVTAGELFFAIRGERFDGAQFAAAALAKGAAGVVVPRGWTTEHETAGRRETFGQPAVVMEAPDTTAALQDLARAVRRAAGTTVVAITGSAGKTTTKELTADLLALKFRVMRNRGNLNNHIGLPLSLIELRRRPQVAVVELGMNHAGEISTLVGIAEPDIRVWTNVGEAHLGFFESVDAIADAKAEIFDGASKTSVLVANADDDRIVARLPRFGGGRIVTFGIDRPADVKAMSVEDRGIAGTKALVQTPAGTTEFDVPLPGRSNLSNVLAATAVAIQFGLAPDDIRDAVARARPSAHRGEIVRLSGGVTVIDDSYNANPTAMKRAVDVLAASPAARRIAVLGEMLELGTHAPDLHEEVGRVVAAKHADLLYTVGGAAAARMSSAAQAAGMEADAVAHFATSDQAADVLVGIVREGDLVLVKGSRGIGTDRVVERLKTERA